jgi:hypothetical protein
MKKLKVGILGSNKISKLLLNIFSEKQNRFEIFQNNNWNQEFVDVGVLDILWICKEYNSNRKLKRDIIRLVGEYNPTLCLVSSFTKPFTILELQKEIKKLNLPTKFVYAFSSCPDILIDWNRYAKAFSFLIGSDSDGSLLLAKTHFTELSIPIRIIKGSFNLEISRLLLNCNYLLYNYIEKQRKKIFKYYERKDYNVERNVFKDIEFETNEGLIEIQKQNLILPSAETDIVILNYNILKLLSNSLKIRYLILTSKLLDKIKIYLWSRYNLIRLRIKGRINKLKNKK